MSIVGAFIGVSIWVGLKMLGMYCVFLYGVTVTSYGVSIGNSLFGLLALSILFHGSIIQWWINYVPKPATTPKAKPVIHNIKSVQEGGITNTQACLVFSGFILCIVVAALAIHL